MSQDFIVKVGQKRIWSYVTACITHFNSGGKRVVIRGRGSSAYKVVEIANALRSSFMKDIIYGQVRIVEDEVTMNDKKFVVPALEVEVVLPERE